MRLSELERVETDLGMDLPQAYREFILVHKKRRPTPTTPLVDTLIDSWFVASAARLITLNEDAASWGPIAGLRRWPSKLFIFGEDGCGNYYAIEVGRRNPAVVFYDHEVDEIRQLADSLGDFVRLTREGGMFQERVLYSAREAARKKRHPSRQPPPVKIGPDALPWQTHWPTFVDDCARVLGLATREKQRTTLLNQTFGGRPVCWRAEVESVELGQFPLARLKLQRFRKTIASKSLRFGAITVELRLTDEDHSVYVGPQVLTHAASWEKLRRGSVIKLLTLIAPGHEDGIACIRIGPQYRGASAVAVITCGAHVAEVIA